MVPANLAQSHGTRPVTVGFLDAARRGSRRTGRFRGQLFPGLRHLPCEQRVTIVGNRAKVVVLSAAGGASSDVVTFGGLLRARHLAECCFRLPSLNNEKSSVVA